MKLIHQISVWVRDGTDFQGAPKFQSPVVVDARWEDRVTVTLDTDGRQTASDATIYIKQGPFKAGDFVLKGKNTSSEPPKEAREIRAYREIPNLTGKKVERRIQL